MQAPLLWIGAFWVFLVFTPRVVGVFSTLSPPGLLCCPVGMKGMSTGKLVPIQTTSSLDPGALELRGNWGLDGGWGFVPQSKNWQRKKEPLWQTELFRPHTPGVGSVVQAASCCQTWWCRWSLSRLVWKSSSCRMSPAPRPCSHRWRALGSVPEWPLGALPMESISTNRCTPAPWLLSVFHLSPSACPSVSLVCFLFAVLCVWQRDISLIFTFQELFLYLLNLPVLCVRVCARRA